MKKNIVLIAFFFIGLTPKIEAQTSFEGIDGIYRILVQGTDLYVSVPTPSIPDGEVQVLTYETLDATSNRQSFTIRRTDNLDQPTYFIESVVEGKGAWVYENDQDINTSVGVRAESGEQSADDAQWFFRQQGTEIFNNSLIEGARAVRRIVSQTGNVSVSGGEPTMFSFELLESLNVTSPALNKDAIFVSNPIVDDVLNIRSKTALINEIEVYSTLGKSVLLKQNIFQVFTNLNTSSLASGLYVIRVKTEKGVFTTKIVK